MIKLIAETHTYVNDSAPNCKYTSVTTVLGKYKEKFDEDYHAQRVADRRGLTKQDVIQEWREINRQAMLGKPSCMLGKHHTDEAKEKIGAAHLGVPSKRKGVLMTKEQRQRLCDLMQQKPKWICPHCGKTGLHLGAANKWHFDKCRSKKEK